MLVKHEFPADGEYVIKVQGIAGYFNNLLGQIKGEQLEITIDGERVKAVRLGQGDRDGRRRQSRGRRRAFR